jgi:hypothetical protein
MGSLFASAADWAAARSRNTFHRSNDSWISAAPADVAAHALADFVARQLDRARATQIRNETGLPVFGFAQKADRRTDLTGRAVAALETVVFDECGLQRMETPGRRKPFNGGNVFSVERHCESQTAIDADTLNEDCAGAALTAVTAFLGPSKAKVLSKKIEERKAGIDGNAMWPAVDRQIRGYCVLRLANFGRRRFRACGSNASLRCEQPLVEGHRAGRAANRRHELPPRDARAGLRRLRFWFF